MILIDPERKESQRFLRRSAKKPRGALSLFFFLRSLARKKETLELSNGCVSLKVSPASRTIDLTLRHPQDPSLSFDPIKMSFKDYKVFIALSIFLISHVADAISRHTSLQSDVIREMVNLLRRKEHRSQIEEAQVECGGRYGDLTIISDYSLFLSSPIRSYKALALLGDAQGGYCLFVSGSIPRGLNTEEVRRYALAKVFESGCAAGQDMEASLKEDFGNISNLHVFSLRRLRFSYKGGHPILDVDRILIFVNSQNPKSPKFLIVDSGLEKVNKDISAKGSPTRVFVDFVLDVISGFETEIKKFGNSVKALRDEAVRPEQIRTKGLNDRCINYEELANYIERRLSKTEFVINSLKNTLPQKTIFKKVENNLKSAKQSFSFAQEALVQARNNVNRAIQWSSDQTQAFSAEVSLLTLPVIVGATLYAAAITMLEVLNRAISPILHFAVIGFCAGSALGFMAYFKTKLNNILGVWLKRNSKS